jgi:hypothetical protein
MRAPKHKQAESKNISTHEQIPRHASVLPVISRPTNPTRKLAPHARLPLHVHPRVPDAYYTSHSLSALPRLSASSLGFGVASGTKTTWLAKTSIYVKFGQMRPEERNMCRPPMRGHKNGVAEQGIPGM